MDDDEKADVILYDTSSNGVVKRQKMIIETESSLYSLYSEETSTASASMLRKKCPPEKYAAGAAREKMQPWSAAVRYLIDILQLYALYLWQSSQQRRPSQYWDSGCARSSHTAIVIRDLAHGQPSHVSLREYW